MDLEETGFKLVEVCNSASPQAGRSNPQALVKFARPAVEGTSKILSAKLGGQEIRCSSDFVGTGLIGVCQGD